MKRLQELETAYQNLISNPPEAVETTLQTAMARAQKQESYHRLARKLGAVGASLCGAVACFAILVNVSVPFAVAMGNVPILREIALQFAQDESIQKAIAHDYVQLIKQSTVEQGVEITLEYLIADTQNLTIFYRVDVPEDLQEIYEGHTIELVDDAGERLENYSASWTGTNDTDEIQSADFMFLAENTLPEVVNLQFSLDCYQGEVTPLQIDMPAITIQERYRAQPKTVPLNQTIAVEGQQIHLSKIDIYPTQTRISYTIPDSNTAQLTDIPFYLTDAQGERIGKSGGGIVGFGSAETPERVQIVDSLWWEEGATYTLHLDTVSMVDKATQMVTYNTETGEFTNLPDYIVPVEMDGLPEYDVRFHVYSQEGEGISDVFTSDTYDAQGNKVETDAPYTSGMMSWRAEDEDNPDRGYFINYREIPPEAPAILQWKLCWAPGQALETPFAVDFS